MAKNKKVFITLKIKFLEGKKSEKFWQEGLDVSVGAGGFATKDLMSSGDYNDIMVAIKAKSVNKIVAEINAKEEEHNNFLCFIFHFIGKKTKQLHSLAYRDGKVVPGWSAKMSREIVNV